MRRLSVILTLTLIAGLLLTATYMISAQERPNRGERPGGGFQMDPAQMMQRMVERALENLQASEEEVAILKSLIEGIVQNRMDQGQKEREALQALRTAVDAKDTEQISTALKALKTVRVENKAKSDGLEKELLELLTVEQEAQLTLSGIVNSDGFGAGFRGGRAPGDMQRPGGMQRPNGARGSRGN